MTDIVDRLKFEINLQQGEAAAWGVDIYGDLPRYLQILQDAACEIERLQTGFAVLSDLSTQHVADLNAELEIYRSRYGRLPREGETRVIGGSPQDTRQRLMSLLVGEGGKS